MTSASFNENTPPKTATTSVQIIRKPIKHLYLRVYADGNVVVSAPKRLSMKSIQAFIDGKRDWIAQKQQQIQQQSSFLPHVEPDKTPPNTLTLFGQTYPLSYQYGQRGVNRVQFQDDVGVIYLRKNSTTVSINQVINTFYRQQLLAELLKKVAQYQPIIGVDVNEVKIKRMKTKWGTCNTTAKRLWFNLHLARLPLACTEYVVVHEMTHLLERYHNRRFYALVEQAMPNWQHWHHYLKKV